MTPPQVTVLTAARNAGAFIAETIKNIQRQTFHDWEYIIVDDASDDNTVEVAEGFAAQDGRIRLLRRDQPGGPYAAANTGLYEARGKYIVRIDADDLSPVHRIAHQLEFLRSHPQFHACITPWQSFDAEGVIRGIKQRLPITPGGLQWYLALRGFPSHSSFTIERDALLSVGGYRELPVAQDYRMMCQLSRLGWLGMMPDVLSFVRRHESRVSRRSGNLQQELAIDVMQEHLQEITGQVWHKYDVNLLWMVGQARQMSLYGGITLIERWRLLWADRKDLGHHEIEELWILFHYHKWKFLHANLRTQPYDVFREMYRVPPSRFWQYAGAGLEYFLSVLAGKLKVKRTKIEDLLYLF